MAEIAAARAEVLRTRDLIGWAVGDPAGANVGTVSDLLIGRDGRVRYLAVKRGLLSSAVLIPVDEVDWGEQSLRLTRWLDAEVRRLPSYDGDHPISTEVIAELERAHPRYYGPPLPFDAPGVESAAKLLPLRQARDFRLPKGAPNVRGWNVFGEDHERIGTVEDMLVDPDAMKVAYLDVDVADDLFLLREDRHVVVPMEAVELRERGEDVWVHGLTAAQVALLPAYTGGPVDPLVEMRVREAFARGSANANARDPRLEAAPVPPLANHSADAQRVHERELPPPPPHDRHADADVFPDEDRMPMDHPGDLPPGHRPDDMPPPLPPRA